MGENRILAQNNDLSIDVIFINVNKSLDNVSYIGLMWNLSSCEVTGDMRSR